MKHFTFKNPAESREGREGREREMLRSVPVHINKNFTGRCVRIIARSCRVCVSGRMRVTREDGAVNRRVFRQVTLSTEVSPSLGDSLSFFRAVAQRDSLYVCLPPFILIYSTLTRLNALRRVRAPRAVSRCPRERIVTYIRQRDFTGERAFFSFV